MCILPKKPKICRYLKKPCIEGDCVHWTGYPATRINELTKTKITEVIYMCDDLWQTKIAFDSAQMADYTGASIDKLRADVAVGQDNLINVLSLIKALSNDMISGPDNAMISGPDNAILPRQ